MSKKIELSRGTFVIVDEIDYEYLSGFKWYTLKRCNAFYAVRNIRKDDKKVYYMHRLITNAPDGYVVDHINRNGLDNRRANLRVCTQSQNMRNQRLLEGGTSKFKGVSWDANRNKWQVHYSLNDKSYSLGRFNNEVEAAMAYDSKVVELFGEFPLTNSMLGLL